VGALVVLIYLGTLALVWVRRAGQPVHRRLAKVLLAVLALQVGLGIANILWQLPLPLAAAHNAGAALLLLTLITLVHALTPRRPALGRAAAPNGV
jgi:cytochrome c oxidase assembly protein subunit 15